MATLGKEVTADDVDRMRARLYVTTGEDRYYSDALVRPNQNLGAPEKAPFHALRVVVGDLGTKGESSPTPTGEHYAAT